MKQDPGCKQLELQPFAFLPINDHPVSSKSDCSYHCRVDSVTEQRPVQMITNCGVAGVAKPQAIEHRQSLRWRFLVVAHIRSLAACCCKELKITLKIIKLCSLYIQHVTNEIK